MALEIDTIKLKEIANLIFDHMIATQGKVVLNVDDYWNVESPEKYDFRIVPTKIGVGNLTDDWRFLESLLEGQDAAVPYMFIHLGPLLSALADSEAVVSK